MDWLKKNVHPRCAVQCTLSDILRVCLYIIVILCGAITCISVWQLGNRADGNCLLSARVKWHPEDMKEKYPFILEMTDSSACRFVIYYNLFAEILMPIGLFIYLAVRAYQGKLQKSAGTDMSQIMICLIYSVKLVLALASAIAVTAGLASFCHQLTSPEGIFGDKSCSAINLSAQVLDKTRRWDLGNFYSSLTLARATSWVTVFARLALVGHSFIWIALEKKLGRQDDRTNIGAVEPSA